MLFAKHKTGDRLPTQTAHEHIRPHRAGLLGRHH